MAFHPRVIEDIEWIYPPNGPFRVLSSSRHHHEGGFPAVVLPKLTGFMGTISKQAVAQQQCDVLFACSSFRNGLMAVLAVIVGNIPIIVGKSPSEN